MSHLVVFRFHNGRPLGAAHRFRPMYDFGYVALDILWAYPEDSGTYSVVAKNQVILLAVLYCRNVCN